MYLLMMIIFINLLFLKEFNCLENSYIRNYNFSLPINNYTSKAFVSNYLKCLISCNKNKYCSYIQIYERYCYFYNNLAYYFKLSYNPNIKIYEKRNKFNSGLIHYWPVQNSSVKEVINKKDLYDGKNANFIQDRFGNQNSAIRFLVGYYKVPSGVYFYGDFTFTAWFRVLTTLHSSRLIDFGNGEYIDNIVISFSSGLTNKLYFAIFSSNQWTGQLKSQLAINLNQWYHIAVVLNKTSLLYYLNGNLLEILNANYIPRPVTRNLNYFGKSNWKIDTDTSSDIDDIKIYNRALDSSEIQQDYLTYF